MNIDVRLNKTTRTKQNLDQVMFQYVDEQSKRDKNYIFEYSSHKTLL